MAQALLIRPVEPADAEIWERMRTALWPDDTGNHALDIAKYFNASRTNPLEVLLACTGAGARVGFIELSIRPYAEGCDTDRVAFVEGWFVVPEHRGRGVGAALMRAAEEWARARRCTELASDTQSFNEESIAAHKSLGFDEVERLVCFRKLL
jgi:aminoglycoside 6'-N-acetyltransferase I